MVTTLYLEVAKSSGAILSYSHEELESSTSDFIEVTEFELKYLNSLEDSVFPVGTISTLSDLLDFRATAKALAQAKAKAAPSKVKVAAYEAKPTKPSTSDDEARQSLIKQIKAHNKSK